MSLEYAILGWLSTGPGSGYDLVRTMDTGLTWFWSAPHSQIYPRLRDLEDRGMVSSVQLTVGERMEKKQYTITDEGLQALQKWSEEPPTYPPNRDAERLKLIFGDRTDLAVLRTHLKTHLDFYQSRRDTLRALLSAVSSRRHKRIEERIARGESAAQRELTLMLRVLAYEGDIARAQNEMLWAENSLHHLNSYEARWGLAVAKSGDATAV